MITKTTRQRNLEEGQTSRQSFDVFGEATKIDHLVAREGAD